MPTMLNVLLVEDDPADADLVMRRLRKSGFECKWERVDTEEAFLSHLKGRLDLILSDYRMPQFSGLRALELLKQSELEIPFIIVSGTIGEETAVEAIKCGAADYLLKDRLGRLGTAVTHAMDESRLRSERRAAEAALRESEARYHGTLDRMLEGCQLIDRDWRYLYLNDTAALHGQQTKDELIGRTMTEAFPGIDRTDIFQVLRRCMEERRGARVESKFAQLDGSTSWFELSVQPVPEGIFVLSLDITERKLAAQKHDEQLDELLRWQEVMLNREDRVHALKAEVNALLEQLHLPPRYSDPTDQ